MNDASVFHYLPTLLNANVIGLGHPNIMKGSMASTAYQESAISRTGSISFLETRELESYRRNAAERKRSRWLVFGDQTDSAHNDPPTREQDREDVSG